jgi:hypothetical protein
MNKNIGKVCNKIFPRSNRAAAPKGKQSVLDIKSITNAVG